jgi:Fur family transcriptional regulator, ferric uptake regulator
VDTKDLKVEIKEKMLPEARILYSEYLKKNKMFFTKERTRLLDFIFDQDGHFSADELNFEMQKLGLKVSRATLYRSLSQMVDAGILSESDFGHGHTHYEITLGTQPHVHLICTDSGDVREVHSQKLEDVVNELARKEGFKVNRYKIQLFGIAKLRKK